MLFRSHALPLLGKHPDQLPAPQHQAPAHNAPAALQTPFPRSANPHHAALTPVPSVHLQLEDSESHVSITALKVAHQDSPLQEEALDSEEEEGQTVSEAVVEQEEEWVLEAAEGAREEDVEERQEDQSQSARLRESWRSSLRPQSTLRT